jgi:membrane protease YdiL (CAAX protease family)
VLGVGEEALFRGVIYEEIKTRTTPWAARLTDVLLFPLVHVPGDIYAGYPGGTIAFQFLWRAGMTLVFDAAYDQGGLPLSAAVHVWSDVLLLLVQWLVYGGVAESARGSASRLPVALPPGLDGAVRQDSPRVGLCFSVPL